MAIEDQLALGNPITSGLRSGDTAFSQDGIQNLLESENTGTAATEFAAPGILSVIGTTDNHGLASAQRLCAKQGHRSIATAISHYQIGSVRYYRVG